jgi:hypothetical protein
MIADGQPEEELSEITVFGNPYHGLVEQLGGGAVVNLPNATQHPIAAAIAGGNTHLVGVPGLAPVSRDAADQARDAANGHTWPNWAISSDALDLRGGADRWIYIHPTTKRPWTCYLSGNAADGWTLNYRPFGVFGQAFGWSTATATGTTTAVSLDVHNFAPDGATAILGAQGAATWVRVVVSAVGDATLAAAISTITRTISESSATDAGTPVPWPDTCFLLSDYTPSFSASYEKIVVAAIMFTADGAEREFRTRLSSGYVGSEAATMGCAVGAEFAHLVRTLDWAATIQLLDGETVVVDEMATMHTVEEIQFESSGHFLYDYQAGFCGEIFSGSQNLSPPWNPRPEAYVTVTATTAAFWEAESNTLRPRSFEATQNLIVCGGPASPPSAGASVFEQIESRIQAATNNLLRRKRFFSYYAGLGVPFSQFGPVVGPEATSGDIATSTAAEEFCTYHPMTTAIARETAHPISWL